MRTNKIILVFILMKMSFLICLAARFANAQEEQTYIIQTEDNMLHFVTDHIESFKLDFGGLCENGLAKSESNSFIKRKDVFADANSKNKPYVHENNHCINLLNTKLETPTYYGTVNDSKSISIPIKSASSEISHSSESGLRHAYDSVYSNTLCDSTLEDAARPYSKHKSYSEIKKISRLDKVIFKDGHLLVDSFKIYVDDLLLHPTIVSEIYISASQEHIPKMINKGDSSTYCKNKDIYTLVVMANVKICLFDLYDYSSRTIQFSQILHLYDIFLKLEIFEDENFKHRLFLNGKLWVFDKKIVAVYMLKEKNGVNYMLKVCSDKSQLRPYNNTIHAHSSAKPLVTTLSVLCLSVLLWFYYSKSIFYGKLLSGPESIYLGKFNKKDALIYHVDRDVLDLNCRIYSEVKDGSLINMFYEGKRMFRSILVTEKTHQLDFENNRPANMFNGSENDKMRIIKSVVRDIAHTVEHFHEKNIFHSRICPENFRTIYSSQNISHVRIQDIFNNPGWESANQIKNRSKKNNDAWNSGIQDDMFSLGCVIHYYLTGFHPFDLRNGVSNIKTENAIKNSQDDLLRGENFQKNSNSNSFVGDKLNNFIPDTENSQFASSCQEITGACTKDHHNNDSHPISVNLLKDKIKKFFTELSRIKIFTRAKDSEKYFRRVLDKDSISHIEYNILFSTYKLRVKGQVIYDLIYHCIKSPETSNRFLISQHPFFWGFSKMVDFLCDASDFIETHPNSKQKLEKNKKKVFSSSWDLCVDPLILMDLCSKRSYDFKSLTDLIRLVRNCHRHFIELKNRDFFESFEGKVGEYFNDKFPELLMFLYRHSTFKDQKDFKRYYL